MANIEFNNLLTRGKKTMSESSVIVAGLVKNVSNNYDNIKRIITSITSCFRSYKVVLYENDSTDNTNVLLNSWEKNDSNIRIISETLNERHDNSTMNIERIQHLATYRNKYMDYITKNLAADFLIVLDTDIIDIYLNGLITSFGYSDKWNCITSNGLGTWQDNVIYYDIEALVLDNIICNEMVRPPILLQTKLLPVRSAFGGLAIYDFYSIISHKYGLSFVKKNNEDKPISEHIIFHNELSNIFINPYQMVFR
jgi:hypothetical protein